MKYHFKIIKISVWSLDLVGYLGNLPKQMNNWHIKRMLSLFILLLVLSKPGYVQSSTDSVVLRYLYSLKDIPAPQLEIKRQGAKTIRTSNFFIVSTNSIKTGNATLSGFVFGSFSSHARKFYLVQLKSGFITTNKIIDSPTLELGISELLSFIQTLKLIESQKATLIRDLTFAYN